MKILIALPNTGMVYSAFMMSLLKLHRPEGVTWCVTEDSAIHHARNKFVETAIKGNYDYLLFVDSDMVLPHNTLNTLLAHDKDIVSGLAFRRRYPYLPCANTIMRYVDGEVISQYMNAWDGSLTEVESVGMACCLIKVDVFKSIGKDWFTPVSEISEDFMFCIRARDKGHSVWVDTSLIIPHIGTQQITDQHYFTMLQEVLNAKSNGEKTYDGSQEKGNE